PTQHPPHSPFSRAFRVRREPSYLYTPLWPMLYAPTFGKYVRPWSSAPTGIFASTWPVRVSNTYTVRWYRPDAHSWVPSGFSCSMSGLPPPGMDHLATTLRVANSMTEMVPSSRLVT